MGDIIFWLVFGGLAGWIASKIMGTDAQQGILLNIIVGIVGAFLGGIIARTLFGFDPGAGFFNLLSWIVAIAGACLLLFLVSLFTGGRRRVR